jgi:hypothetical protein
MDTYKEHQELEDLYSRGRAPWTVWNGHNGHNGHHGPLSNAPEGTRQQTAVADLNLSTTQHNTGTAEPIASN